MYIKPSSHADHMKWILSILILTPIFMTFGCAHKLNLVPHGYHEIVEKHIKGHMASKFASSSAARLDYPITVTVDPSDKEISIDWTKDGELDKTEPLWVKVSWWRFSLAAMNSSPGAPPLCYTDWAKPPDTDTHEFPCKFDVKDYIAKPLMGFLDFQLGGDEANPPGPDTEVDTNTRLYYLVYK